MRAHVTRSLAPIALLVSSLASGCGDDADSSGSSSQGGGSEGGGGASSSSGGGQGGDTTTTTTTTSGGGGEGGGEAADCDPGYAGDDCDECADGYQDADADGVCELGCDATGDDALDCGSNGTCEASTATGARACVCDVGYEGATCDACASGYAMNGAGECVLNLPSTNGLTLWLDAAEQTVSVIQTGKVGSWGDRRGTNVANLVAPTEAAQPTRVANALGGRPVIRFSGTNVLQVGGLTAFGGSNYAVIAVVRPTSQSGNLIVRSHSDLNLYASVTRTATGYSLLHQPYDQPQAGAAISGLGSQARVFTASRFMSPLLKFHRMLARDAGNDTAFDQVVNSNSPDLGAFSGTLRVGSSGFGGDIAELLVYDRQVPLDEIQTIQAYLAAKYLLD